MSVSITPPMFLQFFVPGTNQPAVGYQLFTYIAGTSTKQATWTDSTQTVQNANPIIADANGVMIVWVDPTLTYKFVLAAKGDTDPPGSPIYSVDNIEGSLTAATLLSVLTQSVVGQLIYPRTAAEIAASVTPTNYAYAPGAVDRYVNNTIPGTTNCYAGFQGAINQARKGGVDVTWGYTGLYLIGDGTNAASNALDCTFTGAGAQYGITFRQVGTPAINLPSNTRAGILVNHSAYTVFDLTGCSNFKFYDLSLVTKSVGYPKTCFLTARNSTGESNFPKFVNTNIGGSFSVALLYNYASEDGVYVGNYWTNSANDAGACLVVITATNYFKGSAAFMSSNYTTIFAGSNSCIDHQFFGGQLSMQNPSATSDLFYLDACQELKIYAPWIANLGGRSYFYCEMANGPAGNIHLHAVQGEVAAQPAYGVLFPNSAGTPSGWSLNDVFWDVTTASIGAAGSTPTIDALHVFNLQEAATRGINIPGRLQNHWIEYGGLITVGTGGPGTIFGNSANITITTNQTTTIFDRANSSLLLRGGIGTNGVGSGAGQLNGWGVPINGAVINNFPGSAATLAQCGQALTEIILQLKSIGLFGA